MAQAFGHSPKYLTKFKSLNYFSVFFIGFSNGNIPDNPLPFCWQEENTYGFANGRDYRLSNGQDRDDYYFFSGKKRDFEWPAGAKKPKWNGIGDVIGCGIL